MVVAMKSTKNNIRRRLYGFDDSPGSYRDVIDEGGEDVDDDYDGEHHDSDFCDDVECEYEYE